MTVAVANFIEALMAHYPVKHDTEEREDAWIRSMVGELRGYTADVLTDVANQIIRTRKYRNFPLLSEILDACDKVKEQREVLARSQTLPTMRLSAGEDDWTTERCKLAYDLIRCDLGRQASRGGWVVALWHFCRRQQRLPAGREIDQCKRDSAGIEEIYAKCAAGQAGPCSKALANWAADILAKRKKLAEEVMGR